MRSGSGDVSVVLLTLGEPSTQRVLKALEHQTLAPYEVVTVRDVRPMHAALNQGVQRVATPFFVEVDSDMILDPHCLETLRRAIRSRTGIAVGHLRDALLGNIVGVKLFRTACFQQGGMPDSISPDTDFARRVIKEGWKAAHVGRRFYRHPDHWPTLGEHAPDYTPGYTYNKHLLEGRRYLHRRSPEGIRWHFARLESSSHTAALIAQIGLAHGLFLDSSKDLLGLQDPRSHQITRLERFLDNTPNASDSSSAFEAASGHKSQFELYASCHEVGRSLFETGDAPRLRRLIDSLGFTRDDDARWIAKMGILQGLAVPDQDRRGVEREFALLTDFCAMHNSASPLFLRVARRIDRWRRIVKRSLPTRSQAKI